MKRYIAFLTIVLAVAASCAKQPTGEKYLPAPALQTSTGTVSFEAEGGSTFVSVSTLQTVVAKANKDWVTVSVSGKQVNVSVDANESIETRYALIDITAGDQTRSVQLIQFGVNSKFIWEDEYEFPFEGGSLSLLYQTNATVRLSVDGDWISASTADGVLDITVAQNPLKTAREGSIVWKAGSDERTITIKQALNPSGGSGDNPGGGGDEPGGSVLFSEDFEDINTLGEWMLVDVDGDDYCWEYGDDLAAHSGVGILFSQSYVNSVGALTPDNWVILPPVNLKGGNYVSFWVAGQDPDWDTEHYGVFVSDSEPQTLADLNAFQKLFEATHPYASPYEEETIPYETTDGPVDIVWQHIAVQIPESFDNKAVYIAFRHFNCTDQFVLNLDDVQVTVGAPAKTAASAVSSVKPSSANLFYSPNFKRK